MAALKYVILPEGFDVETLRPHMDTLMEKAKIRVRTMGGTMQYCGHEKTWEDCFSGWINPHTGMLDLLFNFNVGPGSYAVMGSFSVRQKVQVL